MANKGKLQFFLNFISLVLEGDKLRFDVLFIYVFIG